MVEEGDKVQLDKLVDGVTNVELHEILSPLIDYNISPRQLARSSRIVTPLIDAGLRFEPIVEVLTGEADEKTRHVVESVARRAYGVDSDG